MSAIERRQMILEYLSDYRQATYRELAERFGVSKNTIVTDIEELTCSAPIFTVAGKYGGIRVADGWYIGRRYLHEDQEALLRKLLPGLQPEDQKTMERILMSFAKPIIAASRLYRGGLRHPRPRRTKGKSSECGAE